MSLSDTICAIGTGPATGAIGIVRLSGSAAFAAAKRCSGIESVKPRRLQHCLLRSADQSQVLDEALICFMPKPQSYTGEDVVEIFAHGGRFNLEAIVRHFVSGSGGETIRIAEPGEFTRRAFLNGRIDLTQAEAVNDIITARNEKALSNAQALLSGELGQRIRAIRAQLIELAGDLEACIDFADELEQPVAQDALVKKHIEARDAVVRLAGSYEQGKRLNGITVALVGSVNVGKSSLLNALLCKERAVVSDEPGTTRDYVEGEVIWRATPLTLIDTAGARPREQTNSIERAGRRLAAARLSECDVVVGVVDIAQQTGATVGAHLAELFDGADVSLIVANKTDLLSAGGVDAACAALAERHQRKVIGVSALQGSGLERLKEAVMERVFPQDNEMSKGDAGETIHVTQERQWKQLKVAQEAIERGLHAQKDRLAPELVVEFTRAALNALKEVDGVGFTEDVLGSIFSRFCIGK